MIKIKILQSLTLVLIYSFCYVTYKDTHSEWNQLHLQTPMLLVTVKKSVTRH